jgi:putative methanogen marker protein 4
MRIAAGVGRNKKVLEASKSMNFEVFFTESEEELVELLINGYYDAAIRGSLSASKIITNLRHRYTDKISRASFFDLDGHKFFLAPVGIDEGDSVDQKLQIADAGTEFLKTIGMKPKIGVLSGGRVQDEGRSKKIDASLAEGKLLTSILTDKYSEDTVKHYYILIEDAVRDGANFIIPPDGISGNLIFRTLAFLGCGKSNGAVTLGINEIFIDTSRSQDVDGYKRALEFAHYLAESRVKHEINK